MEYVKAMRHRSLDPKQSWFSSIQAPYLRKPLKGLLFEKDNAGGGYTEIILSWRLVVCFERGPDCLLPRLCPSPTISEPVLIRTE